MHWPKTEVDSIALPIEICLNADNTSVRRECIAKDCWAQFDSVCLFTGSETTNNLNNLLNSNDNNSEEKNKELYDTLKNSTDIIPHDITIVSEIVNNIAESRDVIDIVILTKTIDMLTQINTNKLRLSQENARSTDRILKNYEKCLENYAKSTNGFKFTSEEKVTTAINKINETDTEQIIAIYLNDDDLINVKYFNDIADMSYDNLEFAQILPSGILKYLNEINRGDKELKHVITTYKTDNLFQSDDSRTRTHPVTLIANTFFPDIRSKLNQNFSIIHKINNQINNGEKGICSYWKFDGSGWFNESISRNTNTSNYIYCQYDHMTHFTILLGIDDDDNILDTIALIGCILSIIGSAMILLLAIFFRNWRKSEGTPILINLSIVNITEMILLSLLDVIKKDMGIYLCVIIGASLHYIIISQFTWLMIIGYLQYKRFVIVYYKHIKYLTLKSMTIAYTMPLIPVLVSLLLTPADYSNGNYCYPTGDALNFGVIIPIGLLLTINVTLFILTFKSLNDRKFKTGNTQRVLKLSFCLFLLLGLSWIFGFVAKYFRSNTFSYLFTICTTVQGFVTFIYFIIFNKNNRKMIKVAWNRNVVGKRFTSFSTATSD